MTYEICTDSKTVLVIADTFTITESVAIAFYIYGNKFPSFAFNKDSWKSVHSVYKNGVPL